MWSRFKKRFFGGSRKTADDASSLDETMVHSCVLTDADDVRKSRQTLKQFAKDDLHAVPPASALGDKKGGCNGAAGGGGGGGKLKRKLSWFGIKSRRATKSTTSLNSDKRRSGDDAILATKISTTAAAATETSNAVLRTSATECTAATATNSGSSALSNRVASGDRPTGVVVDSVVRITSSKTSSSLLNIEKSLLASRDDVWCSRVEFAADKGTFGASCTSRIEELQRPASLPVSTAADDVKSSPPKLKRRAKPASRGESETRKSRLSKNLPEPDPSCSSTGERSSTDHNQPPAATTTTTTETLAQIAAASPADAADTVKHLKPNAVGASGKRVPPPVPVRKYPPSSTAVSGSGEHPPEEPSVETAGPTTLAAATTRAEDGQMSPSPTRNSPDSGSDDTEGKESGYVTLDDLQAQLMRSSWSSDERDVTDSHNNAAHPASFKGKHIRCVINSCLG